MPRVKRGVTAGRKRARILKAVKGFRWGRKSKERAAKEALLHAWNRSFRGRKEKKRTSRRLSQTKINAASRLEGVSYSRLIASLKKKGVALNRKMLSEIAEGEPATFRRIVSEATKK
ncbi:MAG: 50S ribosomal protein L20 [Candidatus Colwellbacteria bacterium]|nr:50S ribosomal protein L20 [Candidatus Colwellbacteria bacterium]